MEDRIYYRKLIRDNVPSNMEKKGVAFETRTLTPEEFRVALFAKVEEEASGISSAGSREELVAEIADVVAVLDAIKKLEGISEEELALALEKNLQKKGGFDTKTFLEWSGTSDNYQTNEKKG